MFKYFPTNLRQYNLIFLTATVFFFVSSFKTFSQENLLFVKNIKVVENIDVNFSRDEVIDKAFAIAFEKLLSKILLSKDLDLVEKTRVKEIKKLVKSFQIKDEIFQDNKYQALFNVNFDKKKIGNFLEKKSILFSNPENLSVIFFPVLSINGEIKIFNDNVFYNNWQQSDHKNQLIDFVLPFEDLDELSKIKKFENDLENIEIDKIAKKYNTNDYIFAIMESNGDILKIFLKMNLKSNLVNVNYNIEDSNLNNILNVNSIIDGLKTKILDTWKEANAVNFSLILSLDLHFVNQDLKSLSELEKSIKKIEMIHSYSIKEFDLNKTIIKINYYGNPNKLSQEFSRFSYSLNSDQGYWAINKI